MTHEYGHFLMCSMAYDEGWPSSLRGLLNRLTETKLDRNSEMTLMCESFADNFALQVVGGANYVHPQTGSMDKFSTWGTGADDNAMMGWCTGSPCMDTNYYGGIDYSTHPFFDEVARYTSLVYDAFDRRDSSTRFTNALANGDVFEFATIRFLPNNLTQKLGKNLREPTLKESTWHSQWQ